MKSCVYKFSQRRKGAKKSGMLLVLFFASLRLCENLSALEIIAHRGAQAKKPENTLVAERLAQKMGADWLEADIVATKDHQLILSHDLWLEKTTNIAQIFPSRRRADTHFYALDFSLAQLRTLTMRPRVADKGAQLEHPQRIIDISGARITTLSELLSLKNGSGGFYLEPKSPRWHRKNGVDVSKMMLAILAQSKIPKGRVWLECFDPGELKRLRFQLRSPFRQTQLIGENKETFDPDGEEFDFDAMRTPKGLQVVKGYADAIGPRINFVIAPFSSLVARAHGIGLQVHPYVLETDRVGFNGFLTKKWVRTFESQNIEAIFTDQPDVVRALLKRG